jgi:hypothetical protein
MTTDLYKFVPNWCGIFHFYWLHALLELLSMCPP